jgi:tRNA dimethylallyltransferase
VSIYKTENIKDLISDFCLPFKKKINHKQKRKKVIVIAGPTAVGKTKLSISIAEILGGEIISADSMQIYRNMDIGTAKATKEQQKKVVHHLIDSKDINQSFNVFEYYREAHAACRQILLRGLVPIIVGGSGFYIHSFLYGPPLGPPSDPMIRRRLEKQLEQMGPEPLYERLKVLDPEYARSITQRDKHKIVRALEIITITRQKVSDIPKPNIDQKPLYNYRLWFVYLPKERLYERINDRCEEMIQKGFVEEVRKLEKEGLRNNYSASQAIGYRQCLKYLKTNQAVDDKINFINEFKKASKKYVKRQFTWFKKQHHFRWLNLYELGTEKAIEYILQDYEQSI